MSKEKVNDIRQYKNELRSKYKSIRKNLTDKEKDKLDNDIFNKVITSNAFKKSDTIITYVSTDIEIDTRKLIELSLKSGKTVAVPKCIDGTRNMKFYEINSFDDLEIATFSVLEPKTNVCKEFNDFNEKCLCIVPGMVYDLNGYRLGYGKGYYDRFLSQHKKMIKMGLCYCNCTINKLISGRFDVSVDYLVTEKYIKYLGG